MIHERSTPDPTDESVRTTRFQFHNPPRVWRCVFVGIATAMPGTIAGLLLALMFPSSWATCCATTGMLVGFLSGFYMERH